MASKCVWKPKPLKSSEVIRAINWSRPKKKKKHKKAANTKEIIWLLLTEEAHNPTAAKVAISKKSAI